MAELTPPRATVPCKWCRTPTIMLGTRECDPCHELQLRVKRNPSLALMMLRLLAPEVFKELKP